MKIKTNKIKLPADTFTPVSLYQKLRDSYENCILLESSDYHGSKNAKSFICTQPIATFHIENNQITIRLQGNVFSITDITNTTSVVNELASFVNLFQVESHSVATSLFGYTAYDCVKYFDTVKLAQFSDTDKVIPQMLYSLYRYVIEINHFNDEMIVYENTQEADSTRIDELLATINIKSVASYKFYTNDNECSGITDGNFVEMIKSGKHECKEGNLFQVVLSREYSQKFTGDEFNVYRSLRSINPSPYLFFFDFGGFKIFGSSPEAQLVVTNSKAEIHPIAGTFRRTGNDNADLTLASELKQNEKEFAEHTMLVDLARNDLSKNCNNVNVNVFAEVQFYSHLMHLVSQVTGNVVSEKSTIQLFADTFPAGTLSGAPKYKAIETIQRCEKNNRSYYGGAIGMISLNGDINQTIIIRSFLSKDNKLYYRAGAGVVINSNENSELQEVNNKLAALRAAIKNATKI